MSSPRKPARPIEQRSCAYCGQVIFVRPSRIAKSASGLTFCSHRCSSRYKYASLELNAQCKYCGQHFHRPPSELEKRPTANTYCSRNCYEQARQEGVAAKRAPTHQSNVGNTQCAQCGKLLYRRPSLLQNTENQYCSQECKRQFQITTGSHVPREYLKSRYTKCQICGLDEREILVIHHKDENRENNNLENLLVVCPNCHMRIHKGLIR